jgi:hypothetical protein
MTLVEALILGAIVLGAGFALGYAGAQAVRENRMDRPMESLFALAILGVFALTAKQVAK